MSAQDDGALHSLVRRHQSLHNNGCVSNLTQELHLRNLHLLPGTCCCTTENMSTTITKNCTCGLSSGFCKVCTVGTCGVSTGFWALVVVQQRTCQQPCPRSAPVESPQASARSGPWTLVVAQQRACQVTLSKICNCGFSTGFRTARPVGTCLSFEIGTVAVGKIVGAGSCGNWRRVCNGG